MSLNLWHPIRQFRELVVFAGMFFVSWGEISMDTGKIHEIPNTVNWVQFNADISDNTIMSLKPGLTLLWYCTHFEIHYELTFSILSYRSWRRSTNRRRPRANVSSAAVWPKGQSVSHYQHYRRRFRLIQRHVLAPVEIFLSDLLQVSVGRSPALSEWSCGTRVNYLQLCLVKGWNYLVVRVLC